MELEPGTYEDNDLSIVDTTEVLDDDSAVDDHPPIPSNFDNSHNTKLLSPSSKLLGNNETVFQSFDLQSQKQRPQVNVAATSTSPIRHELHHELPPKDQPTFTVVIPPPKFSPLPYATSRSGLVYDVRMRFHEDIFPKSADDPHPEVPGRIASIFNYLMDAGLVSNPEHPEYDSDHQLVRILIRPATPGEICLVHSLEHLDWVRSLAGASIDDLEEIDRQFGRSRSIYVHNNTWLCASLAAGGAIEAAKAVVAGQVRNSIAIIRPPGHHAEHGHAEGFCFFNNVCIAARVMQQEFPEFCRKILILDWDVHHGNGIQRDFYDDPNVLYISIHVHENGRFYPEGPYGNHLHCGEGRGLGRNINIPWAKAHMGDAEYIYAFQQVVMPIAVEFDPDLVFISAGFDAADGDPLGGCHVTPACYGHMTHMLMQLAKGKVVSCLEGGYNLQSIAKSALAMTRVMMGEPPDRMAELRPLRQGIDTVHQVVRTQAKFWKCMYPKDRELNQKKNLHSKRMHDIIREWQSATLWKQHNMIALFVLRQKLSKSFENQVLATQNYFEARPLLVIFHDPPEARGIPNPRTNDLDLHNTWLTDVSKQYLDWAIKQGFAVIDVNIPKHITQINDLVQYEDADQEVARAELTRELAHYLWQNYIETGDSTHILFFGIGDAYVGIMDLFSEHRTAASQVDLTVAFVADNTLRIVNRPGDDNALLYFYKHSLVYVASEHPAFAPERRLKKKYGHVVQSAHQNLQDMMHAHFEEVTTQMLQTTQSWAESDDRQNELKAQREEAAMSKASANLSSSDANGRYLLTTNFVDAPLDSKFDDEL